MVQQSARFPTAASGGGLAVVAWQVVEANPQGGGRIYLSLQSSRDIRNWRRNDRFIGPITYEERESQLYSMTVDRRGTIFVAVASGEQETRLYRSTDEGRSFTLLA